MSSTPLPDPVPPSLPPLGRPARAAEPADRTARWGLALALLVAVGAVALAWDARQSFSSLSQTSGGRLADLGAEVAQSKAALAQAQAALKDSQARLAELESRLADAQESRVAVEDMYRELSRSADDRMLAEVEQLLILASQQLQLAGNVKGALIALEAADQRLSRADKLQAANLRRALNQDTARLKALPLVDTVGLAVKLDGLVQAADTLPLVVSETLPPARPGAKARPPEESGWLRALREFWEELKALVRIRELETHEAALISPAQAYFLRQNLKLRLLAARVALLARDEASYRDDVKASQAWIAKYFDAKARPTIAAQATLKQLAESPVSIVVPDINASLSAARAARAAREKR
jgi:uroporphyrin-III C-methyltransferase